MASKFARLAKTSYSYKTLALAMGAAVYGIKTMKDNKQYHCEANFDDRKWQFLYWLEVLGNTHGHVLEKKYIEQRNARKELNPEDDFDAYKETVYQQLKEISSSSVPGEVFSAVSKSTGTDASKVKGELQHFEHDSDVAYQAWDITRPYVFRFNHYGENQTVDSLKEYFEKYCELLEALEEEDVEEEEYWAHHMKILDTLEDEFNIPFYQLEALIAKLDAASEIEEYKEKIVEIFSEKEFAEGVNHYGASPALLEVRGLAQ
eukprot:CAMPEP_0114989246 /NCGR_PEP_ID=MMETSP0216-20121206/10086_1 /TAXON_ID=223996 /ORGANISM="Protocruzia adherens, Strain Boccale" /LENGTH=260 /DNA_ID=CAMNT_0002352193 /DNA_START=28 /DNA_END=810 /DNA_ORIENTATION=-